MADSDATSHTLDVPGARLYYQRRGTGPLLLLVGSPMDSTGFAALVPELAGRYTVVTYDPRGISNSSRADTSADITPEQQADDVYRLLDTLDPSGAAPAHLLGSSGGATVGLALVAAHPDRLRTLVAHEPPLVELLPDRDQVHAQVRDVYDTYRNDGVDKATQTFMAMIGLLPSGGDGTAPPQWRPPAEELARMRANSDVFLAHLLRQTTGYRPQLDALRAASTRIVVAGGAESGGQLAYRGAQALAERLGTELVEFPGDHGGFAGRPREFAQVLDRVLAGAG